MNSVIAQELLVKTNTKSLSEGVEVLVERLIADACKESGGNKINSMLRFLKVTEVKYDDLPCEGLLLPLEGDRYEIRLSNRSSRTRQKFSLAHELGHILLHKLLPETKSMERRTIFTVAGAPEEERICDKIAASILMPRVEFIGEASGCRLDIDLLKHLSNKFDAGIGAVARRIKELFNVPDFSVCSLNRVAQNKVKVERTVCHFQIKPIHPQGAGLLGQATLAESAFQSWSEQFGWDWLPYRNYHRLLFWHIDKPVSKKYALAMLSREVIDGTVLG